MLDIDSVKESRTLLSSACGKYHFTRLSVLAGSRNAEKANRFALDSLGSLFGLLSIDSVLVVDCSNFELLKSFVTEFSNIVFNQPTNGVNSKPRVILKNCDRDFEAKGDLVTQTSGMQIAEAVRNQAFRSEIETLVSTVVEEKSRRDKVVVLPDSRQAISELEIVEALSLEQKYLTQVVRSAAKSAQPNTRLRSTPFKSSRYFDVGSILGRPSSYIWLVTRMSSEIENIIRVVHSEWKGEPLQDCPRLLACTRTGAALAFGIQSHLATTRKDHIRTDVVDRFGPTQRMIEEYYGGETQQEGRPWYIYVGDIVIGGTELKIAESHSHYRGHLLLAGLVVGAVLPMLANEHARKLLAEGERGKSLACNFSTFSVVSLRPLVNDLNITYEFP